MNGQTCDSEMGAGGAGGVWEWPGKNQEPTESEQPKGHHLASLTLKTPLSRRLGALVVFCVVGFDWLTLFVCLKLKPPK